MKSYESQNRPNSLEKEWYILQPGHQKGPYTVGTIIELYTTNKIEKKIGLWKEGLPTWKFIDNQKELESFLKIHATQKKSIKEPFHIKKSKYKKSLVPLLSFKKGLFWAISNFSKTVNLIKNNNIYQKAFVKSLIWRKKYTKKIKLSLVAIQVLILGIISFAIFHNFKTNRPLPIKYQKSLKKILSISPRKKILFSLKFSKNKKHLIILTNSSNDFKAHLTFESVDKRVLSERKIIFFAKANIKNHVAQVKEFYIIQGKKIKPGEYKVSLKINSIKDPIKIVLFYGKDKNSFEKKLLKFKKRLLAQNINNKNETLERFSTLQSLLEHLRTLFSQEVSKISMGSEINKFAEIYMQQISMIMHGISLDHKHIRTKLNENEKFLHEYYRHLTKLGQKTGLLVADTIDSIRQKGKIETNTRNELINHFSENIDLIQKQVTKNIQSLSSNHKN